MSINLKKDKSIKFRLTTEEDNKLANLCKELDSTKSETMRLLINYFDSCNNKEAFIRRDQESKNLIRDLTNQLSWLGNNVNQISQFINSVNTDLNQNINNEDFLNISHSLQAISQLLFDIRTYYKIK